MNDRDTPNIAAAAYHARGADAGPDPDVPSRAELAADAHADRALERERTVHLAGMLLCAEAHVTRARHELERAMELCPGAAYVRLERAALSATAERLSWSAEKLRDEVAGWTPGPRRDQEAGW